MCKAFQSAFSRASLVKTQHFWSNLCGFCSLFPNIALRFPKSPPVLLLRVHFRVIHVLVLPFAKL